MVARKNLRLKVERVLLRRMRSEFGNGARARVEPSHVKGYLHVYATTKKWAPLSLSARARLIWNWLREEFTRKEVGKVTGLLPLTPDQERRWFG